MNLTFSGRSRWRKSDFVWINKYLLAAYFSKRDTSIKTILCFVIVLCGKRLQKIEIPIFYSKFYLMVLYDFYWQTYFKLCFLIDTHNVDFEDKKCFKKFFYSNYIA